MDAWIIKKFSEYYPKELGKGGELFKLWLLNESNPDGQKPYTEPEIRRVVNIQLQNLKYGASSGLKPNQCADILVYHASRREAKRLRRAHAATKPPLTNEQSKKDVSQTIPTPSAKEATPKPGEAPQPRIIRITRSSVYQEANSAKPTPSAEEATPGPGEAPQPRILRITRSSVRQEANSKDEKQTPKSPEQNPTSGKERVEGGSGVPRSIIARNQGILEDFVEVRRRASLEEQQVLLSLDDCVGENATTGRLVHELRNAPIFAANVLKNPLASETVLPQFGLLGSIRAPKVKEHRYGSDEGFWSPNRPDDMTWASTLDPLNTTSQGEDDPWGLQDEGKGNRTDEASDPTTDDPRVFLNTNIPISAFICGVQGSGKSHTLSCILGKFG